VSNKLEADYLVVGSGGMGMAFTDTLMTESEATVVMVDRHDRPGGHWNDAYPFVRLHQPSSFYGVNSKKLGNDTIDKTGWNEGLYELASASEVVTYFDQVMQQQFLPSGRVSYFPMCEYHGDGRFSSIVSNTSYEVVAKKVVDSTYMDVQVPSVRGPQYEVAEGVQCIAPNDLPKQKSPATGYVLVGGGKTAMDACLWLLKNEVDPNLITWIVPRDSWMFDRANIQPAGLPLDTINTTRAELPSPPKDPKSLDELLEGVHRAGALLRLDDNVKPTMWRCATVMKLELAQLKRVKNIIRQGRVTSIGADVVELEQGSIPTSPGHIHIDCTADGLANRPAVPVFDGTKITLQSVKTCQQVFSAAFIGHIETAYTDDTEKNQLCNPVPHPDTILDFLRTNIDATRNHLLWIQQPELVDWLQEARLSGPPQLHYKTPSDVELDQILTEQNKILAGQERLLEMAVSGS